MVRGTKKSVNQKLPQVARNKSAAQRARIQAKHVAGKSLREIAREEVMARQTVTKIVRAPDALEYVARMREQYLGIAEEALESVRVALRIEEDGRLGHEILKEIGVAPQQEQYINVQKTVDVSLSNGNGRSAKELEEQKVQQWIQRLGRVAVERAKIYNQELPEIELTPQEAKKERG